VASREDFLKTTERLAAAEEKLAFARTKEGEEVVKVEKRLKKVTKETKDLERSLRNVSWEELNKELTDSLLAPIKGMLMTIPEPIRILGKMTGKGIMGLFGRKSTKGPTEPAEQQDTTPAGKTLGGMNYVLSDKKTAEGKKQWVQYFSKSGKTGINASADINEQLNKGGGEYINQSGEIISELQEQSLEQQQEQTSLLQQIADFFKGPDKSTLRESALETITDPAPVVESKDTKKPSLLSKITGGIDWKGMLGDLMKWLGGVATSLVSGIKGIGPLLAKAGAAALPFAIFAYGLYSLFRVVKDFIAGYKTDGIAGGIGQMLGGDGEGWGNAFKQGSKWAGIGAMAGFALGGPVGALVGGIAGMALGALFGFIGGEKITTWLKGAGEAVSNAWTSFTGWASGLISSVASWIYSSSEVDESGQLLKPQKLFGIELPGLPDIGDIVSNAWNKLTGWITSIGKFFYNEEEGTVLGMALPEMNWPSIGDIGQKIKEWAKGFLPDKDSFIGKFIPDAVFEWLDMPVPTKEEKIAKKIEDLDKKQKGIESELNSPDIYNDPDRQAALDAELEDINRQRAELQKEGMTLPAKLGDKYVDMDTIEGRREFYQNATDEEYATMFKDVEKNKNFKGSRGGENARLFALNNERDERKLTEEEKKAWANLESLNYAFGFNISALNSSKFYADDDTAKQEMSTYNKQIDAIGDVRQLLISDLQTEDADGKSFRTIDDDFKKVSWDQWQGDPEKLRELGIYSIEDIKRHQEITGSVYMDASNKGRGTVVEGMYDRANYMQQSVSTAAAAESMAKAQGLSASAIVNSGNTTNNSNVVNNTIVKQGASDPHTAKQRWSSNAGFDPYSP